MDLQAIHFVWGVYLFLSIWGGGSGAVPPLCIYVKPYHFSSHLTHYVKFQIFQYLIGIFLATVEHEMMNELSARSPTSEFVDWAK